MNKRESTMLVRLLQKLTAEQLAHVIAFAMQRLMRT